MSERATVIAQLLASVAGKIHLLGFAEGLQPVHWTALRYFTNCNTSAATVMQFAAHHSSTKGTASTTISLLVKKGLLRREAVEGDRRSHLLKVTDAGYAMLTRDPLARVTKSIEGLDDDLKFNLIRALEGVTRGIRQ